MKWYQRFTNCKNLKFFGRWRPPRGFWMVQKCFLDSASSSFLLHLIKTTNIIIVKYAHFWMNKLLLKNSKLKLVLKKGKKNQGKQAFLGILACFWGSQYEALKLMNINFYIISKQPCIQEDLDLLLQPWKMTIFHKTRSRMIVQFI